MPRTPGPRYREDRRTWIVQIDGRQFVLARDDDFPTPSASKKAAHAAYHRLMAERSTRKAAGRDPALGILVAEFLADLKARQDRREAGPRLAKDYYDRIRGFSERHAATPASAIGARQIEEYLASRTDWGMNRRVDFVRVLGTLYRWAKRRGLIDCPPPEPPARLPRKLKRDKIPTWAEVEAILAAIRSPRFRDFAAFVAWTGCRPSEAAAIEAKHLDSGAATLTEHKTRRKTGEARVIILPAPAREIAERLAREHPSGPIFRSRDGKPWASGSWGQAFDRARSKAKADARITLYSFRHGRATELLLKTGDLASVAAILGNDPTVTGRTYSDVVNQREHLRRIAEIGVTGTPPPPASPPAGRSPRPPGDASGA